MSTFFNPYWLEPGAAVPVDIATTAALVTEIQRLRQALAQPEQEATKQAYIDGLNNGIEAEREACAKVCDNGVHNATDWDSSYWD